ncbi:MAG: 3-deoxy-7-phosphoheptulonate synthase, partial [Mesosutterella sp.]|nr:3-deoxy-7-phosphoheptulonate synthase [Mesosutterella sp.]
PNYDAASVKAASEALSKAGHDPYLMIDASHANSRKICRNQIPVAEDIAGQVADGSRSIMGVMIESNLVEGRQDIVPGQPLVYGQSVTDACLGWDDTEALLERLARAVRDRRTRNC